MKKRVLSVSLRKELVADRSSNVKIVVCGTDNRRENLAKVSQHVVCQFLGAAPLQIRPYCLDRAVRMPPFGMKQQLNWRSSFSQPLNQSGMELLAATRVR